MKVFALGFICFSVCVCERVWSIGGSTGPFAPMGLNTVEVSTIAPNASFSPYASMQYDRMDPAVVADGSRILVIGGMTYRVNYDNAEMIDTTADQPVWELLPKMSVARANLGAVIIDSTVYALGGEDGGAHGHLNVKLKSVEVLDAAHKGWTPYANMSTARSPCLAVAVGKKIYAMGGYDDNNGFIPSVESIDTSAPSQWNTLALQNDKLITSLTAVGTTIYAMHNDTTVSVLDTTVGDSKLEWKPFPAKMISPRCFHGVATVGQKIFVVGGNDCSKGFPFPPLRTVDVLDLSKPQPSWQFYANLTTDRPSSVAVAI